MPGSLGPKVAPKEPTLPNISRKEVIKINRSALLSIVECNIAGTLVRALHAWVAHNPRIFSGVKGRGNPARGANPGTRSRRCYGCTLKGCRRASCGHSGRQNGGLLWDPGFHPGLGSCGHSGRRKSALLVRNASVTRSKPYPHVSLRTIFGIRVTEPARRERRLLGRGRESWPLPFVVGSGPCSRADLAGTGAVALSRGDHAIERSSRVSLHAPGMGHF